MRGRSTVSLLVFAAAALLAAGVASADRKPSSKERTRIARVVHLPTNCARVRISTETKKPKWGLVSFKPGLSECEPLASDGVTVVKKRSGKWRSVIAGSSFDCPSLYRKVPVVIAKDLGIACF
jgi:hypothetical protein